MTAQNKINQKGFTLIELLVVIGILAILLAITLIAINPARQFGQANDTKRRSDVTQILNSIGQYAASNSGQLPGEVNDIVAADPAVPFNSTNFPDLCDQLADEYLPALPTDPRLNDQDGIEELDCSGAWDTGYTLHKDISNRVTVGATGDVTTAISVTR